MRSMVDRAASLQLQRAQARRLGPWSSAMQLVEGRAEALAAREAQRLERAAQQVCRSSDAEPRGISPGCTGRSQSTILSCPERGHLPLLQLVKHRPMRRAAAKSAVKMTCRRPHAAAALHRPLLHSILLCRPSS